MTWISGDSFLKDCLWLHRGQSVPSCSRTECARTRGWFLYLKWWILYLKWWILYSKWWILYSKWWILYLKWWIMKHEYAKYGSGVAGGAKKMANQLTSTQAVSRPLYPVRCPMSSEAQAWLHNYRDCVLLTFCLVFQPHLKALEELRVITNFCKHALPIAQQWPLFQQRKSSFFRGNSPLSLQFQQKSPPGKDGRPFNVTRNHRMMIFVPLEINEREPVLPAVVWPWQSANSPQISANSPQISAN